MTNRKKINVTRMKGKKNLIFCPSIGIIGVLSEIESVSLVSFTSRSPPSWMGCTMSARTCVCLQSAKICLVVLPKKNERKHSVNRKSCTQFAFEIRESVFEWQIFFLDLALRRLWSCCIENQSLVNSNCERVRDDKQSWEEQALREKERKEKISTIKTSERKAAGSLQKVRVSTERGL